MLKMVMASKLYDAGKAMLDGKIIMEKHFCNDIHEIIPYLASADGLFIGNQKVGKDIFESAPSLKFIAKQGSGFDNVDIQEATKRGIPVVISDGINARAVAEHVMMLVLAVSRRINVYDKGVRNCEFSLRSTCQELSLENKTMGLIGYGRIGAIVGEYAKAFKMNISVYDPYIKGIEDVDICDSLDELLTKSDVVSIHVPLTPTTKNLIGEKELKMMKDSSILVNCSRGGIVDENALAKALENEKLWGAGVDVYASEPIKGDNPLIKEANAVLTPHSAALTKESSIEMSSMTASGILAICEGKKWNHVANPDVFNS